MSIFSEVKCNLPQGEQVQLIASSNTAVNPLLAVATVARVLFYNDSGEKMDFEINRNLMPTAICWHPHYSVLAVGWQNGLLTIWNGENNVCKEDANAHHTAIVNITYNQNGHRMVSCDDKGTVAVWRNLSMMSSYTKTGAITHCIFCDLQLEKDNKEEVKKEEVKGRPGKERKIVEEPKEKQKKSQNLFFFGGKAGVVCVADDSNHCTEVCKVSGEVKSLFFYEKMNSMIIITSTFLLVQFRISLTEKSQHDKKVRLSTTGDAEHLSSIWVGQSLVATVCAENLLRAWHLEKDENYVMTLAEAEESNKGESLLHDKILCISYDERNKILAAGTKGGYGIFWKNMLPGNDSPSDNNQWKVLPLIKFGADPVTQLSIGKGASMMSFKYGAGISILYETYIRGRMMENVRALQNGAKNVQINIKNDFNTLTFIHKSNINIRWIDITSKHLLVWSGKKAEIHEIVADLKSPKTQPVSEFTTDKTLNVWMYKERVFLCQNYGIVAATMQGQAKDNVGFADSEGVLRGSNRNNNFLVAYTSNNYIRIYDLSKKELKQIGVTRKFEDSKGPLGENIVCNINCDGSKVSIITNIKKDDAFENVLYIYDVEFDTFTPYKFDDGKSPIETYWDQNDKRFLAVLCELNKKLKPDEKKDDEEESKVGNRELFTFFVSSEHGVKKQDTYPLSSEVEGLCALSVPYMNLITRTGGSYSIEEKPLKDFAGLDKIDDYTKKAIMNFGYFLSIGNMDEAYKSVKLIQNPLVWENMAQMCVKTKRLDVAETCLGNMRFARGAKLVRESKTDDAIEPQLAMLAIQLGMKDEAKKLYEECKRYDLINNMYQANAEWDRALLVAETNDRISLKTTYFKMAKQFEISKDFDRAIEYYEKSGAHLREVPRMLMNAKEIQTLEEYVVSNSDKGLKKWWAQYLESQGRVEEAIKYYKDSEDYSDLVRLCLVRGDFQKAYEICDESSDPMACYHLAKQIEAKGQISQAIQLYAKAHQITIAIKLAIENGMDNEIMSFAVSGPKQIMLKAATYFESKGYNEKAIILYIRGRNFKRALDLSVRFKLWDYIEKITREASDETDPEVLVPIAEYFMKNNQVDKAVNLLIAAQQFQRVLDLCLEHGIPINEETMEKIMPLKENPTASEVEKRNGLIKLMAKNAKKQGNFELASNYYMQIGEKQKAAKCLIKLGDLNKIITFTNNARDPQIYILAGNFLQTSDLHNNPNIMKYIINFYSKAKAYQQLAGFYDGCAALEIDEYRDYEKACAALKEAFKHSQKAGIEAKSQELQQKIFLIEKFIEIKNLANVNPQEMIQASNQLLQNPNIDFAVRPGDIYAQMIEVYYANKDFQSSFALIKQMQSRNIILNHYLDQELLENVFNAVGAKPSQQNQQRKPQMQEDRFQEEDVEDIPENY